jgi:FtsP/CotA-like multicopper oxidase with cupredoxin domain
MKFVVVAGSGAFTSPLPTTLRPVPRISEAEAVQTRTLELYKVPDACTGQRWSINGLRFADITERPTLGTTEIWRWVNRSGFVHPMHMHLVQFQVLDRQPFVLVDGVVTPTGPARRTRFDGARLEGHDAGLSARDRARDCAVHGLHRPLRLSLPHSGARRARDDAPIRGGGRDERRDRQASRSTRARAELPRIPPATSRGFRSRSHARATLE